MFRSFRVLEDVESAIRQTDCETLYKRLDQCRRSNHEWLELKDNPVSRKVAVYC
jgi:hypothetical protein